MISNIESQTVIKERVRITPEKLTAQKKDTLIEKYSKNKRVYSVTSQEEYTTKLIMPYEGYAIVTVIGSEAAGSHTLIMRSPIEMEIVDKPEVKIGYRWKSPRFREGEELDFGLWFKGVEGVPAGWEGGAIRYETGIDTYEFWYDNSMFDGDYDDIVIEVRICSNEKWVGVNIRDTLKVVPIEAIRIRAWIEICDIEEIEGIKYRAEIIKGEEYGEIEDVSRGQRGDILEEIIPEWNNEIELMLNFENKDITEEKEIVIKISTTDAGVIPAYIVIKLIPSSIIVIVEPKEIKPGEEANIILKKREINGAITEFSAEQLFDIRIKEGVEYGTLWIEDWSDTTDEAYYVRAAGLKFKAREEIEENEAEVIIVVNTSPEIMGGNIKEEKGEENRIILRKISNIKEETEEEPLWGIGKVVIKKKDCSTAPQCEGEVKVPEIKVNANYRNGYMGINLCERDSVYGYFYPLITDSLRNITFEDYQIEACYNNNEDKWQVSVRDNEINIRAIKDICLNNIYRGNRIIIENVDDIKNKVTRDSAWVAFVTFYKHLNYPPPANYLIREFVEKHEDAHLKEFENKIISISLVPPNPNDSSYFYKNNNFKNYIELVKSFNLSCSDYDNVDSIIISGRKFYREVNELLRKKLHENFQTLKSGEFEINQSLENIIVNYQDKILSLYPEVQNQLGFINFYLGHNWSK